MNAIFTSRSHRFDSSEANPQNEGRRRHGFFYPEVYLESGLNLCHTKSLTAMVAQLIGRAVTLIPICA